MAAQARLVIEVDEKGALRALDAVNGKLVKTGQTGNVVMTGVHKDTEKARTAMEFLSRTTGVELPRAFQKVIASSATMRTALSAAFNVSIVAGFAAAIAHLLVEAINKVREHLNRFDDEQNQKLYEQYIRGVKIIMDLEALRWEAAKAGQNRLYQLNVEWGQKRAELEKQLHIERTANNTLAVKDLLESERLLDKQYTALIHEERARQDKEAAEKHLALVQKMLAQEQRIRAHMLGARANLADELGAIDARHGIPGELMLPPGMSRPGPAFLEFVEKRRKAIEETVRMEEDAALAVGSSWTRSYREIRTEADRRLREIEDALRRTEITAEDAARRTAAVWIEASARMRDQLASDLERFFSDPLGTLKGMARRLGFQIMASLMLGLQGGQGSLGGIFGGLFGKLFGGGIFGGGGFGLPGATGPLIQNFGPTLGGVPVGIPGFSIGSSGSSASLGARLGIFSRASFSNPAGLSSLTGLGALGLFGGAAALGILAPFLFGNTASRGNIEFARQLSAQMTPGISATLNSFSSHQLGTQDAINQLAQQREQFLGTPGFQAAAYSVSGSNFIRDIAQGMLQIRRTQASRDARAANISALPGSEFGDPNFQLEIQPGAIVINSNQPPDQIAREVVKAINRLALDRGKPRIV